MPPSHPPAARRLALLPVMTTLALTACVATPTPVRPASRPAPRGARPSPAPTPPAPPLAAGATSPTPSAAPELLQPPEGSHRVLAGSVVIDGPYALRAGGARLLSDATGAVLQVGPALLAGLGGNVIANHGGAVLSNQGASVVSSGGGALVAPYGLAQAPTAPLAVGAVLPAAGVTVTARALATGAAVVLGVSPGRAPVTAIRTDVQGRFRLFLPAGDDRIVLEARLTDAQGTVNTDPRLAYDLYPARGAAEAPMDEDGAVAAELMRLAAQGTLATFVVAGDVEETLGRITRAAAPAIKAQLLAVVSELREASRLSGLDAATPAEREAVTTRMAEALIGRVDLWALRLNPLYAARWKGPDDPFMASLLQVLRRGREASTARLREDATFFDRQPYMAALNAALPPGAEPWEIRKPGDFNRFVVREYVIPDKHHSQTEQVFLGVGLTVDDADRMYAAINTFIGTATVALFVNEDGAKDELLAIVRGWRAVVARPVPPGLL